MIFLNVKIYISLYGKERLLWENDNWQERRMLKDVIKIYMENIPCEWKSQDKT